MKRRFVLAKKLSSGGMAAIYLGKIIGEDNFERVCCFKRILPQFARDENFIAMFRDEAHIGKRLSHNNIVHVEGFEEVEGSYAIVMEYVHGVDLLATLNEAKAQELSFGIDMALFVVAEVARGLHFAHTKLDEVSGQALGIVHRDVSPPNILLSFAGEVKITDFGVASAEGKRSETKTGVVKGKFSYMSPEQISGRDVDARSDIFALGILLWELLAGQRLFQGESEAMTIQLVRDCIVPKDISQYNQMVNPELAAIVAKALAKEPNDRYPSANALERELRLFLSRHYKEFTPEDLGSFLTRLHGKRLAVLSATIKDMLAQKPTPPIYRGPIEAGVSVSGARSQGAKESKPHRPTNFKTTYSILLALALFAGILGGAYYYRNVLAIPPAWELRTIPESVRLSIDGKKVENGSYIRSPIILRNLEPGVHRAVVSRDGFHSETLIEQVHMGQGLLLSEVVLSPAQSMAPLEVSLEGVASSAKIVIDDGLYEATLLSEQSYRIDHITFGEAHLLNVTLANGSSFSCTFTPRSRTWQSPFLVIIEGASRTCRYPLR